MITEIDEPVTVGAVFSGGGVAVKWFVWRGRTVTVNRETFRWKTTRGRREVHCFALAGGNDVFEISFTAADLSWNLEKIHLPES